MKVYWRYQHKCKIYMKKATLVWKLSTKETWSDIVASTAERDTNYETYLLEILWKLSTEDSNKSVKILMIATLISVKAIYRKW